MPRLSSRWWSSRYVFQVRFRLCYYNNYNCNCKYRFKHALSYLPSIIKLDFICFACHANSTAEILFDLHTRLPAPCLLHFSDHFSFAEVSEILLSFQQIWLDYIVSFRLAPKLQVLRPPSKIKINSPTSNQGFVISNTHDFDYVCSAHQIQMLKPPSNSNHKLTWILFMPCHLLLLPACQGYQHPLLDFVGCIYQHWTWNCIG